MSNPSAPIRRDSGGWISGPCMPPGSTPVRVLLEAVRDSLTLPPPATSQDETMFLRLFAERARLVLTAATTILANPDADDLDLLIIAERLREMAADFPPDTYDAHPLSS